MTTSGPAAPAESAPAAVAGGGNGRKWHHFLMPCWLRAVVKSPCTQLFIGFVLIGSCLFEVTESVFETYAETLYEGEIHAHHGLLIFAAGNVLRHLADILEGLEEIEEGESAAA